MRRTLKPEDFMTKFYQTKNNHLSAGYHPALNDINSKPLKIALTNHHIVSIVH